MLTKSNMVAKILLCVLGVAWPSLTFAKGFILKFDGGYGLGTFDTSIARDVTTYPFAASGHWIWQGLTFGGTFGKQTVLSSVSGIDRTGDYTLMGATFGFVSSGVARIHLSVDYFPVAELFEESDLSVKINDERVRYITRSTYSGSGAVGAHLTFTLSSEAKRGPKWTRFRYGLEASYFTQSFDSQEDRVVIIRPSAELVDQRNKDSVAYKFSTFSLGFTTGVEFD